MSELPNRWSVLTDFSKTVITLASALLAATITFSGQLLAGLGGTCWVHAIRASWVCLILAILAALVAAGQAYTYLFEREKRQSSASPSKEESAAERWAHRASNTSYFLLFLAGGLFFIASFGLRPTPPGAPSAGAAVAEVPSDIAGSQEQIDELQREVQRIGELVESIAAHLESLDEEHESDPSDPEEAPAPAR